MTIGVGVMEIINEMNSFSRSTGLRYLAAIMFVGFLPLFNAGFDNYAVNIMLLASGILILISVVKEKTKYTIKFSDPGLILLLLLLWASLSVIWSIHQMRTIIELIQLSAYVFTYFLVRSLDREHQFKLMKIGQITAVSISVFGIFEYIIVLGSRILATFPNPNPLGTYLAIFFLLSMHAFLKEKALWDFISSVILLSAIILTGSRGTLLAIVIAIPIIYFDLEKKRTKVTFYRSIRIIATSFVAVLTTTWITPYVQERFGVGSNLLSNLAIIGSRPTSITGRLEFWKVAFKLILNRPLLGYGHGSYFQSYYIEYTGNEWYSRFTHNHYLQITTELGIIGLLLLLGFLLLCFMIVVRKIRIHQEVDYGMIAASVFFLLHIGIEFSWNFPATSVIFFSILGVLTSKYDLSLGSIIAKIKFDKSITIISLSFLMIFVLWQTASEGITLIGFSKSMADDDRGSSSYYQLATKINPFNEPAYRLNRDKKIDSYKKTGDRQMLNDAIQFALKITELTPFSGSNHLSLAQLYVLNNDYPHAIQAYKSAIRYGAYDLTGYIELGTIYLRQSQIDEALKVFLKGETLIEPALHNNIDNENTDGLYQEIVYIYNVLSKIHGQKNDDTLKTVYEEKYRDYQNRYENYLLKKSVQEKGIPR